MRKWLNDSPKVVREENNLLVMLFIEEVGYSIPHPIGILRYIRPVDGIWVYEADTKKIIPPASLNLHST